MVIFQFANCKRLPEGNEIPMVYSMNSVPHVPLGPLGPWSCMGMWHGNVAWSTIRNPEKNGWINADRKNGWSSQRWANVPSSGYGGINTKT